MFRILAVIGVLLIAVTGVSAQEETAEECSAAADALTVIADILAEPELSPLDTLDLIYKAAIEARATCMELSFSSEVEGFEPVIGPLIIPEGIYRPTVTTEGYFIMRIVPLRGECGDGTRMSPTSVFNITAGIATTGAQGVVASAGCEALIEIENTSAPWVLSFEKLR